MRKPGFILEKLQSFKKIWKIHRRKRKGLIFITVFSWGEVSPEFFNFGHKASKKERNLKYFIGMDGGVYKGISYWELSILPDKRDYDRYSDGYGMHGASRTISCNRGRTAVEENEGMGECLDGYFEDDPNQFKDYGFIGIMRRNIMIVNPTKREVKKNASGKRRNRRS